MSGWRTRPGRAGRLTGGGQAPQAQAGEVYFEFIAIGQSMRVTAVDAATGVEVVAIGPVSAGRSDLQKLALNKLRRRLERT